MIQGQWGDSFGTDGFLIIDIEAAAADIIADLDPRFDETGRIENAWRVSNAVRGLAAMPHVLDTLQGLFGREAFPFQTLNFNRGTEQAVHSDTIHFDSTPSGFMAGVWTPLEDIDADNGPLTIYPGSHRLPHLTLQDFGGDGPPEDRYRTAYVPGIQRLIEERQMRPLEVHLKRGQALIWAANLLHGGAPIRDQSRSRHTQVTHYYFAGCSYHTPLLSRARYPVDIRSGRRVGPIAQRLRSLAHIR